MLCTTVHLLLIFINRKGVIFYKIITFFYNEKILLGGFGEKMGRKNCQLLVEKKVLCPITAVI